MTQNFLQKIFPKKSKLKRRKQTREHLSFPQEQTSLFKRRKKKYSLPHIRNISFSFQGGNKMQKMLLLGTLPFGVVILCIFGPFFRIETIYIYRQDNTSNINQAYASVEYIRGKSIFFFDTSELAARLQKSQKSIQNIEFELHLPKTLNIRIKSYPTLFYSNKYLILSNGTLLKSEGGLTPNIPELLLSKDIEELNLFGESLNTSLIKNIAHLEEKLQQNIIGFLIQKSMYYMIEKELLISNSGETIFLFDLTGNIDEQVEKLAIFQKEQEDISQKKYIYIDVRIPGKLFLCSYEEEYSCRKNIKSLYGEDIFSQLLPLPQPPDLNVENP